MSPSIVAQTYQAGRPRGCATAVIGYLEGCMRVWWREPMERTGAVPHGVGSRTFQCNEKSVHDACRVHLYENLARKDVIRRCPLLSPCNTRSLENF